MSAPDFSREIAILQFREECIANEPMTKFASADKIDSLREEFMQGFAFGMGMLNKAASVSDEFYENMRQEMVKCGIGMPPPGMGLPRFGRVKPQPARRSRPAAEPLRMAPRLARPASSLPRYEGPGAKPSSAPVSSGGALPPYTGPSLRPAPAPAPGPVPSYPTVSQHDAPIGPMPEAVKSRMGGLGRLGRIGAGAAAVAGIAGALPAASDAFSKSLSSSQAAGEANLPAYLGAAGNALGGAVTGAGQGIASPFRAAGEWAGAPVGGSQMVAAKKPKPAPQAPAAEPAPISVPGAPEEKPLLTLSPQQNSQLQGIGADFPNFALPAQPAQPAQAEQFVQEPMPAAVSEHANSALGRRSSASVGQRYETRIDPQGKVRRYYNGIPITDSGQLGYDSAPAEQMLAARR